LLLTEAIFGLVGVVIGAVITGGGEYIMRRRDERAQVRAAARLAHSELGDAEDKLGWALESGDYDIVKPDDFPAERWRQHEALFARLLTGDEWSTLERGYVRAQRLGRLISGPRGSRDRTVPQKMYAERGLEDLRAARAVLAARADLA
jgi:hypothetical protein